MVNNKTYTFWNEEVVDYDKQIISVFLEENSLTKEIKNINHHSQKVVADFGCGVGNSFPYLKEFKKNYAIDFSKNMLEFAKEKSTGNEELIEEDLSKIILPEKVDVSLAVSSVVPDNLNEFYKMVSNIVKNTKKGGSILLTFSSFESRIFSFQLDADYMFNNGVNPQKIIDTMKNKESKENFNVLGYMISKDGLVQKQWLKEELLFRLQQFPFEDIQIKKLYLNWETQIKKSTMKQYPNLWMWLVKIKN